MSAALRQHRGVSADYHKRMMSSVKSSMSSPSALTAADSSPPSASSTASASSPSSASCCTSDRASFSCRSSPQVAASSQVAALLPSGHLCHLCFAPFCSSFAPDAGNLCLAQSPAPFPLSSLPPGNRPGTAGTRPGTAGNRPGGAIRRGAMPSGKRLTGLTYNRENRRTALQRARFAFSDRSACSTTETRVAAYWFFSELNAASNNTWAPIASCCAAVGPPSSTEPCMKTSGPAPSGTTQPKPGPPKPRP
mmetsp:Transcript_158076/g.507108  ORF Transcript_158076/g.507108 Transcript_158076/m.507108 type:complete len:250 (-) Transcript_158076:3728-4477(-)